MEHFTRLALLADQLASLVLKRLVDRAIEGELRAAEAAWECCPNLEGQRYCSLLGLQVMVVWPE
jgi:hypothetical protein